MDSKNIKKNQKNKVVLSESETLKKAIKKAIKRNDYELMQSCFDIIEENHSILEYFEEEEMQGVNTIKYLLKLKKNKKDSEEDSEEDSVEYNEEDILIKDSEFLVEDSE